MTFADASAADTGATFKLTVKQVAGGTVDVEVQLVVKPKTSLTPSEAHGNDAGGARLTLVKDASTGAWKATVEVSEAMKPEDVEFNLRHELDEATGLVRKHPGGEPKGGFGPDMQAGVMKAGATTDQPTSHDVATSREIVDLWNAWVRLASDASAKPDNVTYRKGVLDRAMDAGGLKDPSQSKAKLDLLRKAGAPDELIKAVENVEVMRLMFEHEATNLKGATSKLDPALVQHLLYVRAKGDFKGRGLDGGHHTPELLRFVNESSEFAVKEVKTKSAGGNTFRQFEQYKWTGGGNKPTAAEELPGGSKFDSTKWQLSTQPKTTFDDPGAFLRDAEAGWSTWQSSGAAPGADRGITFTQNGIVFGGFVEAPTSPYKLSTLFIEASWF